MQEGVIAARSESRVASTTAPASAIAVANGSTAVPPVIDPDKLPPLIRAAYTGDMEALEALLQAPLPDIDQFDQTHERMACVGLCHLA